MSTLQQHNIKSLLPIDWQAVTLLGKQINKLQGNLYNHNDLAVIAVPDEPKELVLMVASVVANSHGQRFESRLPTEEDLKRLKPWIASIQGLIQRVSPTWAERFGRYVERSGQDAVRDAARFVIQSAEWCRGFKEPRKQFVDQLTRLYSLILSPAEVAGFLENREATIEEKIDGMFLALRYGRNNMLPGFNASTFPLLFVASKKFGFPAHNFSTSEAGIAGAEFMSGIYEFLYAQGVYNLPLPPEASEFDLFNLRTWMRGIAETFYAEKLALVREHLPETLHLVVRVLPRSGPELADAIYGIAERMCELDEGGVSAEEICRLLFK